MQTNQETVAARPPLERNIDLAVPLADIDKEVQQRLRKLVRSVRLPGFRPGKAPFKMVEQQYGPQLRSEALGDAVNKAFGEAVREQNLRIAGYPRIEAKSGGDTSRIEFSATFEVYPEIKLADISGKEIERPMLEVSEAEIDRTLEVLRKQRTTFVAADRSAEKGDRVTIDFTGRLNGEIFQGSEGKDVQVVLGSGTMLPDFESQLESVTAGTQKRFLVSFPEDYRAQDLAGKTAQFDIDAKRVEAPYLPEVNADFARALGIEDGDLKRMREEVADNLRREVRKRIEARVKDQAMKLLLEANPIETPKALVDAEAAQLAENMRREMAGQGVDTKNMPVDPAWFGEQAVRRVKLGLILAEVVREKKLQARPEQVREMVEEAAQSYEQPAEVVRWYYSQQQQMAQVETLVIENNVVEWVLANAAAVDKPMTFDELMGSAA